MADVALAVDLGGTKIEAALVTADGRIIEGSRTRRPTGPEADAAVLRNAVFEAVHGSAPDIALKNLANPTALLLSGVMMLDHIGEREAAAKIRTAVDTVLTNGAVRTRDLGGESSTTEFTDAICREVQA